MADESIILEAKKWLRISTDTVNDEVSQTIDACLNDLENGGAVRLDVSDPLIKQAIKLYLKAQFGYDADQERFEKAYEHLKAALALSGLYNGGESNGST